MSVHLKCSKKRTNARARIGDKVDHRQSFLDQSERNPRKGIFIKIKKYSFFFSLPRFAYGISRQYSIESNRTKERERGSNLSRSVRSSSSLALSRTLVVHRARFLLSFLSRFMPR